MIFSEQSQLFCQQDFNQTSQKKAETEVSTYQYDTYCRNVSVMRIVQILNIYGLQKLFFFSPANEFFHQLMNSIMKHFYT